jgi:nuclear-control-of-ATPase protein 2
LIKSLSTSASKKSLVGVGQIRTILDDANLCTNWQPYDVDGQGGQETSYEHELEWLLLSKATAQAYGAVLNAILAQALPLEDDIWYWEDIASTYRYATLYSIQTSPLRLWAWTKDVYNDVRRRRGPGGLVGDSWRDFYSLVRESVRERSIADIQRRVVSPLALAQNEGKEKARELKKVRRRCANAMGLLLGEGLSYERYV